MAPAFLTAQALPLSRSHAARLCTALKPAATRMELVTPAKAQRLKADGWKHLDVRTNIEFSHGHATDSTNIPLMFASLTGMKPNEAFVDSVTSVCKPSDKIVVMCKSGKRSAAAATKLQNAGFTQIADVEGGFDRWIAESFPVTRDRLLAD